jgi:hypothetical protein
VALVRGAVYWVWHQLTPPGGGAPANEPEFGEKICVLLRDPIVENGREDKIPFVLCSSLTEDRPNRPFEVRLDSYSGISAITVPSMLDGRWVYTANKYEIRPENHIGQLATHLVDNLASAIIIGLQLL